MTTTTDQHFFLENEGEQLLAVVHVPEERRGGALLLLHGWAGYRIGAHRMLVKLARAAAERGFVTMRFDFRGRGDSGGDAATTTLSTMVSDTVAAAHALGERHDASRLALIGDCSGSEVAIAAAPLIEMVDSLVLWSVPIVGGDRAAAQQAKRTDILRQYAAKLLRAESWRKVLGGRVRLDMIGRAIAGGGAGVGEEGAPVDRRIDWLGRFREFSGERLFIYGGSDPGAEPAQQHYRQLSEQAGQKFACHIVPGANHAFYSTDWEREVIQTTLQWLQQRYEWDGAGDGR